MKDKPTIVFLLESISQPRCIKRVNSFITNGFNVEIYGIDRGVYTENNFISGVKVNVFDKQRDGKDHIKKLFKNYKSIKKILKKHDNGKTVFYSFGYAITITVLLSGCKKFIYEISDILYGYKKYNFLRPFFKLVDKLMINKSLLTVLTSEGFADFFYKKEVPENIIIQPNKLSPYFLKKQRPTSNGTFCSKKIKFAYVGAFRFPNTIFRFANIIGEYFPEHEFHFYGDSALTNQVISISNKYDNVKYHGSFKNPDDLSMIYKSLDILVTCYDAQDLNVRIAEPNKLYESLFFNKPIIVSKETFLSKKVEMLSCGYSIDALNDESIKTFVRNIKEENIIKIKDNISRIPNNEIVDDNSNNIISYLSKKLDS
jgi:glycosyltransferase involved in cell wall biosynthesis